MPHLFAKFWFLTLLFCALPPGLAQAEETVLYSWEFNSPGDFEGWTAAGGLKDAAVKDGALQAVCTSRDPIFFMPKVEFATKPGVVMEIRMKSSFTSNGELFFSNTKEGPFGGFSGDKMKNWPMLGDGEFHTVRFLPGWLKEGKIIQLRFDPGSPREEDFGKASIAIDSVRIIDLNYDSLPFSAGNWDFRQETAPDAEAVKPLWEPAGAEVEETAAGWKFTFDPKNERNLKVPRLESGPVRLKDGLFQCWCTVEMAVSKGMAGRLILTNDALKLPIEVPIALIPDGKFHTCNLLVLGKDLDPRQVHFLTLEMSDAPDANAVVKSIRFSAEPQGPAQILVRDGGGLTDALCRAGRPLSFEFILSNPGGKTAKNLKIAKMTLPKGVTLVASDFPKTEAAAQLEPFDALTCRMKLQSRKAVSGTAAVSIQFEDGISTEPKTETFEFPITILPSLNLPKADYVPEPQPVKSDYEIGALYFPGWGKPEAWERIFPVAPIRKPVLGWYREFEPECIDWQIKWAVENGIQYFLVDWYWSKGNQHLDHWVKGFQKAKYRSYFKWAMMWANHNGPGSHSEEDQAAVTKFWIENYFNTPEYYTIDGRPVVMIWSPDGMDRDVREIYRQKGVELKKGEGVKKLLDLSQKMAKEAGLKGIFFITMKWPEGSTRPEDVQWLADAGFEMTSLYHYMEQGGKAPNPKYFSFDYCVDSIDDYWEARQETGILPFLPNLSTGWDSRPWHGLRQTVIYDRTPEKFRKICEKCKAFTQKYGIKNVVLAPLNEWGEGSYAEPNKEFGFEMFEAVRETFCEKPAAGWPQNYAPADVGLGPYDFSFAKPDMNAAMNATFDSADAPKVWTSLMGITEPAVQDGKLTFQTTHRDPAIQAKFQNLLASRCSQIVIRLRVTPPEGWQAPTNAQLFWSTHLIPASESTSQQASVPLDGQFHDLVFPVSDSQYWQGKIEALRFDPCSVEGAKVEIDFIRLEK